MIHYQLAKNVKNVNSMCMHLFLFYTCMSTHTVSPKLSKEHMTVIQIQQIHIETVH